MKFPRTLPLIAGSIASAYVWRRPLLAQYLRLPPVTYQVDVQRKIFVPMPDGVRLAANHYAPRGTAPLPAILIRTPYNKGNYNAMAAQRFAERGYHVISQDVRGRFDSEGVFEPYVYEREDGVATLAWIADQPWCDGQVGMWGQSYVGYVQWAAASAHPPQLQAMVASITQSDLAMGRSDEIRLDQVLRWLVILDALDNHGPIRPFWQRLRQLLDRSLKNELAAIGVAHLPLATADSAMLNRPIPILQEWLKHEDLDDDYWHDVDFSADVGQVTVPTHLVGGWYDIFLDGMLADFGSLQQNGRTAFLTIGPWAHMDLACQIEALRQGLDWFDRYLKKIPLAHDRLPVRVFIMGANQWREMTTWPPPAQAKSFYLHERGQLSPGRPAADSPPDRYRYDPAQATPNIGGALISSEAGPQDNRALEARADVLTYTTPPLTEDLEVIGPVRLELYAQSTRLHTDFHGRLCDVYPDGRSINICDGLRRLQPEPGAAHENGCKPMMIELSPTAYRFRRGHRIRLQVSSGAFPRINRNLGTGEPVSSATRMVAADQTIFHDAARPSALILPVILS